MKLQDLTFEHLTQQGIYKLPTTTDSVRVITSRGVFDMWKHEFERFAGSDCKVVNCRLVVTEMEAKRNQYTAAKAAALGSNY